MHEGGPGTRVESVRMAMPDWLEPMAATLLRHVRLIGVRHDKDAREVHLTLKST